MARTFSIEKTVYTYEELSETAKQHAREQWNRFLWEDGSAQESMELLFDGIMADAGWQDAKLLSYSLYSQGGYPTFSGTLPAFEHDGHTYAVTASEHSTDVEIEDVSLPEDDVYGTPEWDAYVTRIEAARQSAKDMVSELSSKLLSAFLDEDEYLSSDEAVAEAAEANGYEYDEDGNLA